MQRAYGIVIVAHLFGDEEKVPGMHLYGVVVELQLHLALDLIVQHRPKRTCVRIGEGNGAFLVEIDLKLIHAQML